MLGLPTTLGSSYYEAALLSGIVADVDLHSVIDLHTDLQELIANWDDWDEIRADWDDIIPVILYHWDEIIPVDEGWLPQWDEALD